MGTIEIHRSTIKKDAQRKARQGIAKLQPTIQTLEIGGHKVTVPVVPREVDTSGGKKTESKPRMTSMLPLTAIEGVVGRDAILYQNALSYSQRESDQDVVDSVIKGSSEIGLIAGTMPEMNEGIAEQVTILASFNLDMNQHNISNPIYLIGKAQVVTESGK